MSLTPLGKKIFAKMDPEAAHRLAINLLRFGLFPNSKLLSKDPILEQDVFCINFSNPICLAAGFDKNAEAFEPILALGCGFVEVGSFSPDHNSVIQNLELFAYWKTRLQLVDML